MKRRDFLKNVAMGGAALGVGSAVLSNPAMAWAYGDSDFGMCKSVRIKCISELGWYESADHKGAVNEAVAKYQGLGTNITTYVVDWDEKNNAGACTLIEMETLDGEIHKFLLDTGFGVDYMTNCFARENVHTMLKNKEIEFVALSHEHGDHIFGLEALMKWDPSITVVVPEDFQPDGLFFIRGGGYKTIGIENKYLHTGKVVKTPMGQVTKMYDGCALVNFDVTLGGPAIGEQSFYFNVKDKGIVCVTGCCHQGIGTLGDFALENFDTDGSLYGIYGGLHMAPHGTLLPGAEEKIYDMARFDFQKVAANHCTGTPAVQLMKDLGYPVVGGTGRYGSKSDIYVGNGDEVLF